MSGKELMRQTIMNVLTSASAKRINFTLGSIHVDYAGFMSVFMALTSRAQGEPGIDIEFEEPTPGAGAEYGPDDDTFYFPHGAFGLRT
jgi:hypothetical protein